MSLPYSKRAGPDGFDLHIENNQRAPPSYESPLQDLLRLLIPADRHIPDASNADNDPPVSDKCCHEIYKPPSARQKRSPMS